MVLKEFEGDGCNKNISSKVNAVIDIDGLPSLLFIPNLVKVMTVKELLQPRIGLVILKRRILNFGNKALH
jgi:hypothetical protein